MSIPQPPVPPRGTAPKQPKGCLFYGCLGLCVLALAGLVMLYFGYQFVRSSTNKIIAQYTDTNAVDLGHVELPPEDLKALQQRISQFSQALESKTNAQELTLSAEEINGLIAAEGQGQTFRDRLFVHIQNNRLQGDVSIPLQDFGPLKLKGRFLNGAATFKVNMVNGNLDVRLDELRVNDQPLPSLLQAEFQNKNLAEEMMNDPKLRSFLNQLESVKIKDGRIIIRNKVAPLPEDGGP
jgi:hypothetical protein